MEKTFTISMDEYDKAPSSSAPLVESGDAGKEDLSVSIRKIDNGYLVCKSWYEGPCENRCYMSSEMYYQNNPLGDA